MARSNDSANLAAWNEARNWGRSQCDQIGRFMKVIANNFHAKVAQIYGDFLGYFENINFQ